MKNGRKQLRFEDLPRDYAQLVALHAPRPIHDDAELERATAILDALAGHRLNADQEDYLDIMAGLVSDYERRHHPVATRQLSPREALRYLLEEAGMNASDLGRLLGNRELGSKLLRGERGLSLSHISRLAEHFAVSPELFLGRAPARLGRRRAGEPGTRWRAGAGRKAG